MTRTSRAVIADWQQTSGLPGVTTASLLTIVVVSTIIGGFTAMFASAWTAAPLAAVIAGLLGTLAAGLARTTVLIQAWNAIGIADAGTPTKVIVLAAIASLAGSLTAYQLISAAGVVWPGVTGMLAGLLSGTLMSLLIVAYQMQPESADREI